MTRHIEEPLEVIEYGTEAAGIRMGDIVIQGAYRGGNEDNLHPDDARYIARATNMHEGFVRTLQALHDAGALAEDYGNSPQVNAARKMAADMLASALADPGADIHVLNSKV